MTAILTSLLCLGLSLSWGVQVQHGVLPKPTIWAEPGSLISMRKPGAIWCRGSWEALQYYLTKEGISEPWDRRLLLESKDKAKFSILQMAGDYAGRYHCRYCTHTACSAPSDTLELVMTGSYDKPNLSAFPMTGTTSKGNVTFQCDSRMMFERWTCRCYGSFRSNPYVWSTPSDILEYLTQDLFRKLSLQVHNGLIMASGETLTLRCLSDVRYDRFGLSKDGESDLFQQPSWQPQPGHFQADFPLGPLNHTQEDLETRRGILIGVPDSVLVLVQGFVPRRVCARM
ncbi:leukocyte immunoglobulin-like receptor subfamily A member 6 [Rhynchocyon petersi]